MIDEGHRGSVSEDSAWREILTYFGSATYIGLTATRKETKEISNSDYFGDPIHTCSLKQSIEDGYLAPYKVIQVDLDKDTFEVFKLGEHQLLSRTWLIDPGETRATASVGKSSVDKNGTQAKRSTRSTCSVNKTPHASR